MWNPSKNQAKEGIHSLAKVINMVSTLSSIYDNLAYKCVAATCTW
jgi:hypothetical protein